jgi:glycosyltransferase involved in cell wall biosynthesis
MELAVAQAALGHTVSILGNFESSQAREFEKTHAGKPHASDVTVVNPGDCSRREHLFPRKSMRSLRSVLPGVEFVHLHGVWCPLLYRTSLAAKSAGIPYALCPHSMLHPWQMERYRMAKALVLAAGRRRMLREAHFVQANTRPEVEFVHAVEPAARVEVIPNGIYTEQFDPPPDPDAFRRSRTGLSDRPYILFLGRLHYQKGIRHLAEAFIAVAKRRPEAALVVAGPDGGEQAPFEARIEKAGLEDRVLVTGPLYGREKFEAMAGAACFCLPSLNEGFSMAILEALACGAQVVISENCWFPEVEAAGAGRVVPLDSMAVADALCEMLENPDGQQKLSEAATDLIEREYTCQKIAKRIIDGYGKT